MNYQIDTDIIIYHLRKQRKLKPDWFEDKPAISIITLGELLYGAQKSNQPQKSTQIIENFINDFQVHIIPIEEKIIKAYAKEKAALEKTGHRLDDFDLLIGITARENRLTLVTNNYKHFTKITGLNLYK